MIATSLGIVLLEAAAGKLERAAIPPALADEAVFLDPKGPRLWAQLMAQEKFAKPAEIYLLGRGTRGAAFAVDDRVLKVTTDESEATASSLLVGKPDPAGRMAVIYAVYRLAGQQTTNWAVMQERLDALDEDHDHAWIKMADWWPDWTAAHDYMPMTAETAEEFFEDTETSEIVHRNFKPWQAFKVWFSGLAQYLDGHGVVFHDFWHRNLMRRGDQYVAIDLGYSHSERPEDGFNIETLARYRACAAAKAASATAKRS